jgi:hypothetical protein
MFEEKSPFLGVILTILAIIGAVATVFSCVITLLAFVNPKQLEIRIKQIYPLSTPTPIVIVETAPTPTAPATYTPYPTNTPYPTYTPLPTFIKIPVAPTPTPYPTYTPFPTLTDTPIPPTQTPFIIIATATPVPTSTAPENTPPGTVLATGETWKQDGLYLTLDKVELGLTYYNAGTVEPEFVVENRTGEVINFEFNTRNVVIVANNGIRFERSEGSDCTLRYRLDMGETFSTIFDCPWKIDDYYGNYFDPSVDYLLVTVSNFGRIDEAKWKIPITH